MNGYMCIHAHTWAYTHTYIMSACVGVNMHAYVALMSHVNFALQLMAALHARKCVAISSRAVSAGAESSRPFYKNALAEAVLAVQLCPEWAQAHLLQVCVVYI